MAELAQRLQEIDRAVVDNREKISGHISNCELRNDTVAEVRADHETRIRKLEEFKWKAAGIIGAVCFAATFLAQVLGKKLLGG